MSAAAEVLEAPITAKQIATLKKWRYTDDELSNISASDAEELKQLTFRHQRHLNSADIDRIRNQGKVDETGAVEKRGALAPEVIDLELDAIYGSTDEDLRPELKHLNKSMKEDMSD